MVFRRLSTGLRRQAANGAIAVIGVTTVGRLTLSPAGVSAAAALPGAPAAPGRVFMGATP